MANEKGNVKEWLQALSEASKKEHYSALYKKTTKLLSIPSRRRVAVSIFKINKYTKENDNVLVPRKVLGTGKLDHKVRIAALELSSGAQSSLKNAGCEIVEIKEMVKRDRIQLIV